MELCIQSYVSLKDEMLKSENGQHYHPENILELYKRIKPTFSIC
jgi:hypothetical protein